jgi:hypothetical protein
MNKFVKIGADIINLDAVSNVQFLENQSGISDRIIIQVGEATVTVDSAIGGKKRMEAIRQRLMEALQPEDWDQSYGSDRPAPLPALASRAA